MSLHGSLASAGSTAAHELWQGVESTGSFVASQTDQTADALRSPFFAVSDGLTDLTSGTAETAQNLSEGAADSARNVSFGITGLGEGLGTGLEGLGEGTGEGLQATGEGIEGLGTFGGIGITAIVVLGIAVVAFLYVQGDL